MVGAHGWGRMEKGLTLHLHDLHSNGRFAGTVAQMYLLRQEQSRDNLPDSDADRLANIIWRETRLDCQYLVQYEVVGSNDLTVINRKRDGSNLI